jgi:hypothetical protein
LDDKEVKVIANSISKWTHANFSDVAFREYVIKTHSPKIQSLEEGKVRGEDNLRWLMNRGRVWELVGQHGIGNTGDLWL